MIPPLFFPINDAIWPALTNWSSSTGTDPRRYWNRPLVETLHQQADFTMNLNGANRKIIFSPASSIIRNEHEGLWIEASTSTTLA